MEVLILKERSEGKPKQLRATGMIPIGYMQRGKETLKLQASEVDLRKALSHMHGSSYLPIKIDGESKKRNAIVKMIDESAIDRKITTVVFMDIALDEVVTVDVGVHGIGTPTQVAEGEALLGHQTSQVRLKGVASDIPKAINIDVSQMQIGDSITAGQVILPEGIELASSGDATLFSVQIRRAAAVEEEEAAAGEESAEPEVVGEESSESEE